VVRLRPLHKLLHKRLRIPQQVVGPVLSSIKAAVAREEVALRRELARDIARTSPHAHTISQQRGYHCFGPGRYAEVAEALVDCEEIFERLHREPPTADRKVDFLRNLATGIEVTSHRALLKLMVSRPVVDAAASYLGSVPLLEATSVMWSPPNSSTESSQRFHFDDEDSRQVKLFINVREVGPEHGPLTLMSAQASKNVLKRTGTIIARATDERVLGAAGEAPVAICGPPGSGVLVDTGRCLHYGSRRNSKERLLFMAHYLRIDAPSEPSTLCGIPDDVLGLDLDPIQRLVLRLPIS